MHMSTVFDVLRRFRLCKGFPVLSRKTHRQRRKRGKIVDTTDEWLSRDDITVALYLRSTQYYVLLQQYTRPVNHYP